MRNHKRQNGRQAGLPANVVASIDAVPFLEGLVKYLAERRHEGRSCLQTAHPGWEIMNTCSIETFISGNLGLADKNRYNRVPFASCFIFTCIRGHEGAYDLTWSNSLS